MKRFLLAFAIIISAASLAYGNWLVLSKGSAGGAPPPLVPTNTVAPAITGQAAVGSTLVAIPGKWANPNHTATPVDGTYALVFDEEFNGTSLDHTKWNDNWFGNDQTVVTTSVNGAGEDAAYDPAQIVVKGGFLTETTINSPVTVGATTFTYRTGHIDSNPSSGSTASGFVGFAIAPTTGNPVYMEVRTYVPGDAAGTPNVVNWPSFFTGGQNWPTTGEIDVFEALHTGAVTGITANYHSSAGAQNSGLFASNYVGWHVFGALWTTTTVTYYYDGVQVKQYTTGIASAPNYVHVHNAMGTAAAGADVAPATLLTEYVHIYLKGGTPITPQANYEGASPSFTSYSYQWYKSNVPIAGATSSTYVPVLADAGSTISVSVAATNAIGTSTFVSSPQTATVTGGGGTFLPADRLFAWNPGMTSKGGIPVRNTVCGPVLTPLGNVNIATSASAGAGGSTLTFASAVPATITIGIPVTDTTHSVIPATSVVASVSGNTVVLRNASLGAPSAFTGGGVISGDNIQFTLDDHDQIQNAINNCTAGQVVSLSSGTFTLANGHFLLINSGITVRGAGKGATILSKPDGSHSYPAMCSGLNPSPLIIVGPAAAGIWPGQQDSSTNSSNLTSDAAAGAMSVNVANASAFLHPGQIVLLDELSGAGWVPDTTQSDTNVWAAPDYRVVYRKRKADIPTTATTAAGGTVLTFANVPFGIICCGSVGIEDITNHANIPYASIPTTAPSSSNTLTFASVPPAVSAGMLVTDASTANAIPPYTTVSSKSGTQVVMSAAGFGINSGDTINFRPSVAALGGTTTVTMSNPSGPGVPSGDVIEFPNNYQDDFGLDQFPTQINTFGDVFSRLDRVTTEIKEIASVSGNTITFTSPISISYRTSHTAQLTWYGDASSGLYVPHVQNAGVESLSMIGADNGSLVFQWAAYSWAKNIEVSNWCGFGVNIAASFRIELRQHYIHDASWMQTGGGAYEIVMGYAASENLIEDGISILGNKVIASRAAGAGSVIGYNYFDMGGIAGGTANADWIEMGLNASHLVGSHHILFEGNYGVNADSDITHGASDYIIFFRNHLRGVRHTFTDQVTGSFIDDQNQTNGPKRTAGPMSFSYWFSYVGNVMGLSGQMSGWTYSCTINWGSCPSTIWLMGWGDFLPDSQTNNAGFAGHIIRDGNWDWVNSQQKWETTPATFPIPASMYLGSKPAFFAANPWPWVDPSTGTTNVLPAKARFDGGCAPGTC